MAIDARRLLPIAALVCAIALADGDAARAADAAAQSLYDQAVAARNRGAFAGAIDKLAAARRTDRNNIAVLTLVGRA